MQELAELFYQVPLGAELGLGLIMRDARVACLVVKLERRVPVAECLGFSNGLSLEIAVVAGIVADRWNDAVVAFGKPMPLVHASLHCCIWLTWRSRRARWREVRETRLRAPVARRDRGQTAPNFLDDYLLRKDAKAQAEGVGIKIEVTTDGRIE